MFCLKLNMQRGSVLLCQDDSIGADGFTREFGFLDGDAAHAKEPLGKLFGIELRQAFAQVIAFQRRRAKAVYGLAGFHIVTASA